MYVDIGLHFCHILLCNLPILEDGNYLMTEEVVCLINAKLFLLDFWAQSTSTNVGAAVSQVPYDCVARLIHMLFHFIKMLFY